jgi:cellulose synthase/poly-beta-1,6-N-acetylglucosamine synthase-like glycosyltransferase
LNRVVVVASSCPPDITSSLDRIASKDPRLEVVVEKRRHGKAEAVNQVLERSTAEILVMLNSDARPMPGAIAELLTVLEGDRGTGIVSARPIPEPGHGAMAVLSEFMWTAHNDCSLALNHMNVSNHSSDELFALRRSALTLLPEGLVNDGTYLATRARQRGYRIRFSNVAGVGIQTPSRVSDAIGQRRRILFGHTQVWRKTGSMPRTIESLLVFSPTVALRILVKTIARDMRFLAILPVAVVSEGIAAALSTYDTLVSTSRHAIWRRYT